MPLLWISLAILSGIVLGMWNPIPSQVWFSFILISVLSLLPPLYARWKRFIPHQYTILSRTVKISRPYIIPLCFLALSLGAIRFQATRVVIDPSHIAYYNDHGDEVLLEGVLVQPPDVRETYTNLRITVEQLIYPGVDQPIPVSGLLLARTDPNNPFQYGDRLRVKGHLETPPENPDFSYRDYLANHGVYSYLPRAEVTIARHNQGKPVLAALYKFRDLANRQLYRQYPDPEASLLAGILLGIQSGIPGQVQEAFRLTGTSHIIVISGYNISIIMYAMSKIFNRLLGIRRGSLITFAGVILYTLLVGANPAVVRAAILGIFTLGGRLLGRRQTGINSLLIAAAGMAVVTPTVLWDVSFQLSFAATLGLILFADPFTDWFISSASRFMTTEQAERLAAPIGEYFLLTLAAQLTTLPLMAFYFKRFSLISLVANPLILPAQPALMILGGLSVLSGLVVGPLGQLFAWAAWPFTAYTIRIVEWLATFPNASIPLGQVAMPLILAFYAGLFFLTFARAQLPRFTRLLPPAFLLAILAITTVFTWKSAFYAPDRRLHVTILDVGTGNAVLVQSPSGRFVLMNGGPSTVRLSDVLGRRLPPFHRTLDWLLVGSLADGDLSGLPGNLDRFPPANALWAGASFGTGSISRLWAELVDLSVPITRMQAGQSLDLDSGASLQVISVSENGAVLLLQWDSFRMLLPMGLDSATLEALSTDPAMRNISALLLAQAGFAAANPPALIHHLNPQLVLLSVAAADRHGLPSPETMQALQGYPLLRTDQNGWIEITTDGKQMWVEVEKK